MDRKAYSTGRPVADLENAIVAALASLGRQGLNTRLCRLEPSFAERALFRPAAEPQVRAPDGVPQSGRVLPVRGAWGLMSKPERWDELRCRRVFESSL